MSIPLPTLRRKFEADTLMLNLSQETLQSNIDNVDLDQFLPMLSVVDQEKHISTIPPLDRDHPMFYWIFKNIDFARWNSAKRSRVLWLSGLPERKIHQVSSYIVGQEKNTALKTEHFVLYFFFSTVAGRTSSVAYFVHTLLKQMVCCLPLDKGILIIRSFLHSLLERFKEAPELREQGFKAKDLSGENIRKILDAPANELLTALMVALGDDEQRSLSVVVDGLDKVEHQRDGFIKGLRAFVEHLQQRVKILLTSRPQTDIKEAFDGLLCIEYDKERKGLVVTIF